MPKLTIQTKILEPMREKYCIQARDNIDNFPDKISLDDVLEVFNIDEALQGLCFMADRHAGIKRAMKAFFEEAFESPLDLAFNTDLTEARDCMAADDWENIYWTIGYIQRDKLEKEVTDCLKKHFGCKLSK